LKVRCLFCSEEFKPTPRNLDAHVGGSNELVTQESHLNGILVLRVIPDV
jgi:hypothetical protein